MNGSRIGKRLREPGHTIAGDTGMRPIDNAAIKAGMKAPQSTCEFTHSADIR